jgi:hypothetical protein
MLQVVTHNGLPPNKGGKRLGYIFARTDGSSAVVPAVIVPPPMPGPPPTVAPAQEHYDIAVPRTPFDDVRCECRHYIRVLGAKIVVCAWCDRKIKVL